MAESETSRIPPPEPYKFTNADWEGREFFAIVYDLTPENLTPALREKWALTRWGSPEHWYIPELWTSPEEYMRIQESNHKTMTLLCGEEYVQNHEELQSMNIKLAEEWLARQLGHTAEGD